MRDCLDKLLGLGAVGGWLSVSATTAEGSAMAAMAEPTVAAVVGATALAKHLSASGQETCASALKKAVKEVEQETRADMARHGTSAEFAQSIDRAFEQLATNLPNIKPTIEELATEWRLDPQTIADNLVSRFEEQAGAFENNVSRQIVHATIERAISAVKDDPDIYKKLEPAVARATLASLDAIHQGMEEANRKLDELVESSRETAKQLGLQEGMLIQLARNYADDAANDFNSAHRSIEQALKVAADDREKDKLPSNLDDAVKTVLQRMADLNETGDFDGAQAALHAELQAMDEDDRKRKAARARLYQRGMSQAILRNSPKDAAEYSVLFSELEGPLSFEGISNLQTISNDLAVKMGKEFELRVALRLAEIALIRAVNLEQTIQCMNQIGISLQHLGERKNDKSILEKSITILNDARALCNRLTDPNDWAMSQNNLGVSLFKLGRLNRDPDLCDRAIKKFNKASSVFNRKDKPLRWAGLQLNTGAALTFIGDQNNDPEKARLAIKALSKSLKEFDKKKSPDEWATCQHNIGDAYQIIGQLEEGTQNLKKSAGAYRKALSVRKRTNTPWEWATSQCNLGVVLHLIGKRNSNNANLREAIDAYRASLTVFSKKNLSHLWGQSQYNLGETLRALGERENGTKRLKEAVIAYRRALEERTRFLEPFDWASTQNDLGNTLSTLGQRELGANHLGEAMIAYGLALEEYTREQEPLNWAAVKANLGHVIAIKGEQQGDCSLVLKAVSTIEEAIKVIEDAGQEKLIPLNQLTDAQAILAKLQSQ
ncbi:MAG: hypothetical protein AAFQ10_04485 [Pseudomonadota bacterium]